MGTPEGSCFDSFCRSRVCSCLILGEEATSSSLALSKESTNAISASTRSILFGVLAR
jgi:hypothetical protein